MIIDYYEKSMFNCDSKRNVYAGVHRGEQRNMKRRKKSIYVHSRRTGVVETLEVRPGNRGKRLN